MLCKTVSPSGDDNRINPADVGHTRHPDMGGRRGFSRSLSASYNMGQPIDEKVLTPTGWQQIGELSIGGVFMTSDYIPTLGVNNE